MGAGPQCGIGNFSAERSIRGIRFQMTAPSLEHFACLTPAQLSEVEDRIESFEQRWHRGERPQIDDHLPADSIMRKAVLVELVCIDIEFGLKAGDAISVEFYLRSFPELANDSNQVARMQRVESDWR